MITLNQLETVPKIFGCMILNLFYEEPDEDRWLLLDRFPRQIVRRIVRGKPQPGGQMRVFLNLKPVWTG
jgi:hypothetical protein